MIDPAMTDIHTLQYGTQNQNSKIEVLIGPVLQGESGYACPYLVYGLEQEYKGTLFGNTREQARRLTTLFVKDMLPFWNKGVSLTELTTQENGTAKR